MKTEAHVFRNIDAPGNAINRRGVKAIQRVTGAAERKAAAEAKRAARAAKRARDAGWRVPQGTLR